MDHEDMYLKDIPTDDVHKVLAAKGLHLVESSPSAMLDFLFEQNVWPNEAYTDGSAEAWLLGRVGSGPACRWLVKKGQEPPFFYISPGYSCL